MGRQQRNTTTSSRPQTPRNTKPQQPTQQTAAAPTKPEMTTATTPRAPISDAQQQQQQQQQLFTPRQQQQQQQQQQALLLTPRRTTGPAPSCGAGGSNCPGCVCACPCVCGARWGPEQQQPPTTPRGTSGSQLLRGAAKGVHKIGNAAISEFKRALHEAEKLESAAGRMDLKGLMLTPRGGQKQGGSASTSAGSSNASTACSTPRRHYGAFQQDLPSPELALQRAAAVIREQEEQEEIAHEMKEVEKANIEQGDWISSYEAKGRLPPVQNTAQRPQTPRSRAAEKSAINSVKELAAKFKRDLKTSGGWKDSETANFLKQEAPEIFRHSGNSYRVPTHNSRAGPPEQASCVIC